MGEGFFLKKIKSWGRPCINVPFWGIAIGQVHIAFKLKRILYLLGFENCKI